MAAALRAAEGGVYFFQILRGGIFKIFPARGVYPPYPPIPDPCINAYIYHLQFTIRNAFKIFFTSLVF